MSRKKITAEDAKTLAKAGAIVWWTGKGIKGMNRFYDFFLATGCPVLRKVERIKFYVDVE